MYNYHFQKLPLSFFELWQPNVERHAARELRNANDCFIPQYRIELAKRMPLFSFPAAWNAENNEKFNPSQPDYLKSLKNVYLIIFMYNLYVPPPSSPPSPPPPSQCQ
jgi:hypothetical protein